MNKFLIAAAFCVSGSAFAQLCEVQMVDMNSRRPMRGIPTFRAYDFNDDCKEGMKACRLDIRQRGLLGRADCERLGSYPDPNPYPNPNPYPYPNPNPNPYPNPYPSTCQGSVDDIDTVRYFQRDYFAQPGDRFASYNVFPATTACKIAVLEEHRRVYYYDSVSSPAREIIVGQGRPNRQVVTCDGTVDDVNTVRYFRNDYYTEGRYDFASYDVRPDMSACRKAILDQHRQLYWGDMISSPARRLSVTIEI